MFPSDKVRISPLVGGFSTVGATALCGKTRYNGQGDFSVLVNIMGATIATGQSGTVAANYDVSVLESTAATQAGSVITGATMTLGSATALTVRGAVSLVCKVASNLATTVNLSLNGKTYHISTAGATADNGAVALARAINGGQTGATADNGAVALARAINGGQTGATAPGKLPHYIAIANYSSANLMLITGDDDMGTGITAVATSGGVQMFHQNLQGVIDVQQSKLSTTSPKYIGFGCTNLTGADTAIIMAQLVSWPTATPCIPGSKVVCAT